MATDIDAVALANAQHIVAANGWGELIELRRQVSAASIFNGVLRDGERFDLVMCNPPFHASRADAVAGTRRKWKNLGRKFFAQGQAVLNFGGQQNELYCEGGESVFVRRMIAESEQFKDRVLFFTSLVSKAENLQGIYHALMQAGVARYQTMEMAQGQKKSRIVAWSFQDDAQCNAWRVQRWQEKAAG